MGGEGKAKKSDLCDPEELFREADLAEERGGFRKAFRYLSKAAQLGDAGSQLNLGNFYSWGRGVKKDMKMAAFWYKKAYRNGFSSGAHNLAIDRRNEGRRKSAITWFNKAVAMNDGSACLNLAKLYLDRRGDAAKARELLVRTRGMNSSEISEEEKEEAELLLASLTQQ